LAHVFKHDAVVGGIEGAFEVRVHDVDVLVMSFGVLRHHRYGGESIVDAAVLAESVFLVAKDAVGFGVFRACILY
jgi:hypothetical protein